MHMIPRTPSFDPRKRTGAFPPKKGRAGLGKYIDGRRAARSGSGSDLPCARRANKFLLLCQTK